tara:strand:- start:102 stop:488 length:387 start_codon:yes stop_codon:yes gene_type:complete
MSDFSAEIKSFNARALEAVGVAREGIITSLYNSVILDTPVDTGRAIGNWQTSAEQPKLNTIERVGESGALAEVRQNMTEGTMYLTNNLPYIERLEYGYSKIKSPDGMVRKNIARMGSIIKKEIATHKL